MEHNQKPQGDRSGQDARTDSSARLKGSSAAAAALTPAEDRRWATLSHFGALIGCFPALAVYLVYRDRGPFTAQESKEALNFTLPLTAVMLACYILALIPAIGWVFGLLAVLIWVTMTISGLVAGIQCNKGRPYRYPLNLRLIH
ncbi:DUF4870 domain-containing protein [Nesterenkonia sp. LB17]|uniref:DUF4870 domain-containing protein n=1 Tax=unclassified Nesterenkonia TaxID=2629769 RepID=UPI001F4C56C7|nr:DUF4870 domain-containing protein [Nesterenkonia sp. DZ6]MCH8563222.1 DUF4870 domain-containing protein [Nesterenkonia sp. YGD6]MCH8564966.1 DUF4870 domain-containing protein [Nesterenkonia sp. LB17]MCH8571834.1 DUF4870 domain-containing protein [Nesterenkonia sp. AY15]